MDVNIHDPSDPLRPITYSDESEKKSNEFWEC